MVRRKISPTKLNDETRKVRKSNIRTLFKTTGQVIEMRRKLYKEIRTLQNSTGLVIPRLAFRRLVKEIVMEEAINTNLRIQSDALKALHEALELYMVQFFEDSYNCTLHAKRKTLMINDMQLVRKVRGRQDVINH